jgi:hypothetical protein
MRCKIDGWFENPNCMVMCDCHLDPRNKTVDEKANETARQLEEWIRGPGEAVIGRTILNGARVERKRLERLLEGGGLFPHVDHETRTLIERLKNTEKMAQDKIDRHDRRQSVIDGLSAVAR